MNTGRIHNLKLDIEFCDAVLNGDKSFEIRINDRGFQKGDFIKFTAEDKISTCQHPINNEMYKITYVLNGYGLKEDFVCLAIKRCQPTSRDLIDYEL